MKAGIGEAATHLTKRDAGGPTLGNLSLLWLKFHTLTEPYSTRAYNRN